MHKKSIQCSIKTEDKFIDIALSEESIYSAYMLLDQLMIDMLEEVALISPRYSREMHIRKSREKEKTIINDQTIYISDNCIDCVKQMIYRYYLNPYDAKWIHLDIEALSETGDTIDLCIHL